MIRELGKKVEPSSWSG